MTPLSNKFDGEKDRSSVMSCCGQAAHAWDQFRVATEWVPDRLRCLIVGENPGSATTAYFYDGNREVAIRSLLLEGLYRVGIIAASTLSAFRNAGFLFDHGIRCHLAGAEVATQRRLARTYSSPRANAATHLTAFIRSASSVWAMGYVARNAVAAACAAFPRDARDIARCPYSMQLQEAPKFFASRYLTRAPREDVAAIFREFGAFWVRRGGDDHDPSNSAV
jgi:hypothetical protein